MSRTPLATIDGVQLDGAGPVGWTFLPGVAPHRQTFSVDRLAAERVFVNAEPFSSTLVVDLDPEPLVVGGLTVVRVSAGSAPYRATIEVADRRWHWKDRHVRGHFNMRRRTGERRRPPTGRDTPAVVQPLAADEAFAAYSLKDNATPWTARTFLEEVLRQLLRGEPYRIEDLPPATLPIEDLVLDDVGGGALGRALSYFGGLADVTVDHEGVVVVYNRVSRSDLDLLRIAGVQFGQGEYLRQLPGPEQVVGAPLWDVPDRRIERPERVRVAFSRLAELRFDYREEAEPSTQQIRNDPPLVMENVLPNPDFELEIPSVDGRPARTVPQGTYITIQEALAAWNALGEWFEVELWGTDVTLEEVRGEWFGTRMAYRAPPEFDEDGLIRRRLNALFAHYRQTFRINRGWRDRLGELLPIRVELLDPETGTQAPAEAYADYAVRYTQKQALKSVSTNAVDAAIARNVFATGDSAGGILDAKIVDMRPAPAAVQVIDPDEGIVRVDFGLDPRGGEAELIFCALEDDTIGSVNMGSEIVTFTESVYLNETFELSVVVSTTPVVPNDLGALHTEQVTPTQAATALGIDADQLGPCDGPEAVVRVLPMRLRAVARHRWDDDRSVEIRQAYRQGDPTGALLGSPLNPAELEQLALAYAARVYGRLLDHPEGQLVTGWSPSLEVTGVVSGVTHTLNPDGTGLTSVAFDREFPNPDPFSILPENVRQVVLGEVIP